MLALALATGALAEPAPSLAPADAGATGVEEAPVPSLEAREPPTVPAAAGSETVARPGGPDARRLEPDAPERSAASGPEAGRSTPVVSTSRAVSRADWAPARDDASLPPAAGTDVPVVHVLHRASAPEMATRARRLIAALRGEGFAVEPIDSGDLVVRSDRLRFFHADDRAAAEAVAAALAEGVGVQDFSHYEPPPPPGTLELWLRTVDG